MGAWWNSLEAVAAVTGWLQIAVAACGVLTAASAIFLWVSGAQLTRLQSKNESAVRERIARLEIESAAFRQELDSHPRTKKSAEANVDRRASARSSGDRPQTAVFEPPSKNVSVDKTSASAPTRANLKRLSTEERRQFAKILRRGPKGLVEIFAVDKNNECVAFAKDLTRVFTGSGWKTDPVGPADSGFSARGITMLVRDGGILPPHAAVLQRAFESVNITVSNQSDPTTPDRTVRIVVGPS